MLSEKNVGGGKFHFWFVFTGICNMRFVEESDMDSTQTSSPIV